MPTGMRLARLLLLKSCAETLFLAALGLGVYLWQTPPVYRGWSEVAGSGIAGWAVNRANAEVPVEVQLYVDERFAAEGPADRPRPDVVAARQAINERCGFHFPLGPLPEGFHEARIYAVHRNGRGGRRALLPLGAVVRFRVAPDGTLSEEPGRGAGDLK